MVPRLPLTVENVIEQLEEEESMKFATDHALKERDEEMNYFVMPQHIEGLQFSKKAQSQTDFVRMQSLSGGGSGEYQKTD